MLDGRRLQSCDILSGAPLVDARRCVLGTVDELLVDLDSGEVCFVVVCRGGADGRLVVVPWGWLHYDGAQQRFVLQRAKDALEAAPAFDDHQRPDLTDRRWQRALAKHPAGTVAGHTARTRSH